MKNRPTCNRYSAGTSECGFTLVRISFLTMKSGTFLIIILAMYYSTVFKTLLIRIQTFLPDLELSPSHPDPTFNFCEMINLAKAID
jgi:hypothetical protein